MGFYFLSGLLLYKGFYFLSGLLLYMGLGPAPTLSAAKMPPQSRLFYGYTNTFEYLRFMSASFLISGITSIQHTDARKNYQHRFPFPAFRVFSIWMYLNIVSAILYSRHYKCSAFHLGKSFTYQSLRIWFFGFNTWTLDYSADLILLAFSISCGGEFHLSRFTHLILRLYHLNFRILYRPHPSCLQYLIRGRVLSTTLLLRS